MVHMWSCIKVTNYLGRDTEVVYPRVRVHAFYSKDPNLNPTEVFSFNSCLKRAKMNKRGPCLAHIKTFIIILPSLTFVLPLLLSD